MAYYFLNYPWALRGWQDKMLCLVNLQQPAKKPVELLFSEFSLLSRCNGAHDLPDSEKLQTFLQQNIISEGTEPLKEEQEFQMFPYVHRGAAEISITNRCNYHCKHCLAGDASGKIHGELSLETIKSLILQLKEMDIYSIVLTGGEPLLHPDIMEILRFLSEQKMILSKLLTNGAFLTDEFLEELLAMGHRPEIHISFDGFGTHDWMRNAKGAEEKALSAMELIHSKGLSMLVGINVNRHTMPVAMESCRILVQRYHPTLYVYYTSPTARWLSSCPKEDLLSLEEYYDFCIELSRNCVLEQWDVNLNLWNFFDFQGKEYFDSLCMLWDRPLNMSDSACVFRCSRAKNMLYISSDGSVLPCSGYDGTVHEEDILLGKDANIYNRSLADILTESSFHLPFCVTFKDLKEKEALCRDCKWLYHCCGGCRLLSMDQYRNPPELDRKSESQCLMFRGEYMEKYRKVMEEAFRLRDM